MLTTIRPGALPARRLAQRQSPRVVIKYRVHLRNDGFAPMSSQASNTGRDVSTSDNDSDSSGDDDPKNPMTPDAAARIQSSQAKAGDGGVDKGSFAARAQSAAAKNANAGKNK